MRHIELFSGIGGFRQAMRLLSKDGGPTFSCVGYSEIDPAAQNTYRANFDTADEIEMGDIAAFVKTPQLVSSLPEFELLTGGFPCQSFSMMGGKLGFNDARGTLFFSMAQLIQSRKPKYLLLENVKNLITHDGGKTYHVIERTLADMGYSVHAAVFNSADFGLAQTRNRVYIFATTKPSPNDFFFTPSSVKDFFDCLSEASLIKQKRTLDILRTGAAKKYWLSEKIKRTILSNGSGGFVSKSEIDLDTARPLCATMAKMHRACQDNYFSEDFIVSSGRCRYTDGVENANKVKIRRLMPEEAFELQGFPASFVVNAREKFLVSDSNLYKQAGNAVSVNVVYAILAFLSQKFNWR